MSAFDPKRTSGFALVRVALGSAQTKKTESSFHRSRSPGRLGCYSPATVPLWSRVEPADIRRFPQSFEKLVPGGDELGEQLPFFA
jgi:hypothetical protein